MEKSDLRKYVCVRRLLDSLTNLNAWSWNRLSLSQIFSFYVRPLLWLTLIHHDILYHTLIPYFPVTARTNGVPFLSSAQASLCLSHRREVGKREEKARKGRSEQRRTPPLLFFSYFLFPLEYAAGASVEERGVPLYPSLKGTVSRLCARASVICCFFKRQ